MLPSFSKLAIGVGAIGDPASPKRQRTSPLPDPDPEPDSVPEPDPDPVPDPEPEPEPEPASWLSDTGRDVDALRELINQASLSDEGLKLMIERAIAFTPATRGRVADIVPAEKTIGQPSWWRDALQRTEPAIYDGTCKRSINQGSFNCVIPLDDLILSPAERDDWEAVYGKPFDGLKLILRIQLFPTTSNTHVAMRTDDLNEFVIGAFAHDRGFGPRVYAFGQLPESHAIFYVLDRYTDSLERFLPGHRLPSNTHTNAELVRKLHRLFRRSARAGIIHADGKSGNILYRTDGRGVLEVVFTDFDSNYMLNYLEFVGEDAVHWSCLYIVQLALYLADLCDFPGHMNNLAVEFYEISPTLRDYIHQIYSDKGHCGAAVVELNRTATVSIFNYIKHYARNCAGYRTAQRWEDVERLVFSSLLKRRAGLR
jgi:hypothetical protein